MSLSASKEHLIVPYPNVPYTPYAWSSRDLCLSRIWALTSCEPILFVGPNLRGPPLLSVHRCPMYDVFLSGRWSRSGLYTSPQSRAVTCFSEETKWSPWRPTWDWCRDVNSAPNWHLTILFYQHTRGKINDYGLLALALPRIRLNLYAPFTVSLLHLSLSQIFLILETLYLLLENLYLRTLIYSKVWSLLYDCPCFIISMLIKCHNCSGTIYVFHILRFLCSSLSSLCLSGFPKSRLSSSSEPSFFPIFSLPLYLSSRWLVPKPHRTLLPPLITEPSITRLMMTSWLKLPR